MCSGSNEICQALPLLFRHDEIVYLSVQFDREVRM